MTHHVVKYLQYHLIFFHNTFAMQTWFSLLSISSKKTCFVLQIKIREVDNKNNNKKPKKQKQSCIYYRQVRSSSCPNCEYAFSKKLLCLTLKLDMSKQLWTVLELMAGMMEVEESKGQQFHFYWFLDSNLYITNNY